MLSQENKKIVINDPRILKNYIKYPEEKYLYKPLEEQHGKLVMEEHWNKIYEYVKKLDSEEHKNTYNGKRRVKEVEK